MSNLPVRAQLGVLEGAGLIELAAAQPELEYIFRHALVKDAAYLSLVKGDRRQLHQLVGEALERQYAETADPLPGEVYALLAYHFGEAGSAERAVHYYSLAAEAAAHRYANREAAELFARALAFAAEHDPGAGELARLYTRRGRVLELAGDYDAALDNYQRLETIAAQRGDRALELAALIARATVHVVPSDRFDLDLAGELDNRAMELARALNDRAAEAKIQWNLMLMHGMRADLPQAIQHGRRSLHLARKLELHEQLAYTLTDFGRLNLAAGRYDTVEVMLEEAADLWRALGNSPMLAETLNNMGSLNLLRGDFDRATEFLQQGYALSETTSNAWGQAYALMLQSLVHLVGGRLGPAFDAMERCIHLSREGGFIFPTFSGYATLGMFYGYLGAHEAALAELEKAKEAGKNLISLAHLSVQAVLVLLHLWRGDVPAADEAAQTMQHLELPQDAYDWTPTLVAQAQASLAMAHGDYAAAEAKLIALKQSKTNMGQLALVNLTADLYVRTLLGQGQAEAAEAAARAAHDEAVARGNRLGLWVLAQHVSNLAAQRGDAPEAQAWRRTARALLEDTLASLDRPSLRDSFLSLPQVRALLPDEPAG